MMWAGWIGVAQAAPACGDLPNDDWASVGACLQDEGLPEAAIEAWRRAWNARSVPVKREERDAVLAAATRLAHDTGDDALLVEVARTLSPRPPSGAPEDAGRAPADALSDDVRSHVALADGRHDEVRAGTCAWPLARYRLAADLIHQHKWQAAVLAYSDTATATATGSEARQNAIEHLRESALLGAASVYLGLEADSGVQFSQIVQAGAWPDLRGYARAFGTWRMEGGAVRLRVERDAFVPEAAGLGGDPEIARWRTVSRDVAAFLTAHGEPSDPVLLARIGLPEAVAGDVGRVWTVALLEGVAADIDDERRSAGRDPMVLDLLDARAADVGQRLGVATLAAIRVRLARIRGALAVAEQVRDGARGVAPVVWSRTDHGD